MKTELIVQKLKSLKLNLEVHPENEPNSEFEDRINSLDEIIQALEKQESEQVSVDVIEKEATNYALDIEDNEAPSQSVFNHSYRGFIEGAKWMQTYASRQVIVDVEKFIEEQAEKIVENCDRNKSENCFIHESEVYNAIVDAMNKMQTYASNKESDAVWVEPSKEAIEFAEWISSKGFYRNRSQTDKWWITEDLYYSGCFYTTEELYNQFKKQKEGK